MKHFLPLLTILCSLSTVFGQSTYYIAANGSDNNNGLSQATPFLSIAKINSVTLQAGDKVLFRKGDTFRGTLQLKQSGTATSPITVDAYGSGDKPILSGSVSVTGWVSIGGNIWQATCSACANVVTGVYRGGQQLPLGRSPNESDTNRGYLTVQSHAGNTQFTSKETLSTNWVGAEVVIRPVQWILDRAKVTQQSGNTLTINNTSTYTIADNWGYFIQNHPSTLDKDGEWYYNPSDKTLRIYSARGRPDTQNITATVLTSAINTFNVSYINISNLRLSETVNIGLYMANMNNITVSNTDIINSGENAIEVNGSGNNIVFEGNLIEDANNNGFLIQQYNNFTFRNNTVHRVGLIPGRGKSGDGQYWGFASYTSTNATIEYNRLDSIGYTGLVFHSNTLIQRNTISNFCMTKSDGGGLYTWNGDKSIMSNIRLLNNIVYNAIGAPEGAPLSYYLGANGIDLDDCAQNIEMRNNTVFDCNGLGIILHATNNVLVDNNTSINNSEGQFVIAHNNDICATRNNTVTNNVFVGKAPSQSVARYESVQDDLPLYGDFNNNYYLRPFNDVITLGAGYKDGQVYINSQVSLPEWQALTGEDANSKTSPIRYKGYKVNSFVGGNRIANSTFDSNNIGWGKNDFYGNGSVEWDNTGRIDGGSLKVGFSSSSGHRGSYVFAFTQIGSVTSGKSYVLSFDALASAASKTVQIFIRKTYDPYQDLDTRQGIIVSNTRGRYELAFTANGSEDDAIVMFRTAEDGKTLWLDNVSLREASITKQNPNDYILLLTNTSTVSSTLGLGGTYRDAQNNLYSGAVTLTPFSSKVLLRDTTSGSTDVAINLRTSTLVTGINKPFTVLVRVKNESSENINTPVSAQWRIRLPPNVVFVSGNGLSVSNDGVSGSVSRLSVNTDTLFQFQVRVVAAGTYGMAAQIVSSSQSDPDSTPDSGTADGEDDAAAIIFRTSEPSSATYYSPNPNQRPIPVVIGNQPSPTPNQADLSARLQVSKLNGAVNETLSFTISVTNMGGANANFQVKSVIGQGLQFVSTSGWTINGNVAVSNQNTVGVGETFSITYSAKIIGTADLTAGAEIYKSTMTDPDSTPDNGLRPDSTPANGLRPGEDDQNVILIRAR